jgi:hypothetical protein
LTDENNRENFDRVVNKKVAEKLQKIWCESDVKVAKEVAKTTAAADDYTTKIFATTPKYDKQVRRKPNHSSKAEEFGEL